MTDLAKHLRVLSRDVAYTEGHAQVMRAAADRLEAAERERDEALNFVRVKAKANARWRRLMKRTLREAEARAVAAEAKIAAVRLYCENQGDKFRYHAARILAALRESEGE